MTKSFDSFWEVTLECLKPVVIFDCLNWCQFWKFVNCEMSMQLNWKLCRSPHHLLADVTTKGCVCLVLCACALFSLSRYHWCSCNALNRKIIELSSHANQMEIWFTFVKRMSAAPNRCLYQNNKGKIARESEQYGSSLHFCFATVMICLRAFKSTLYCQFISRFNTFLDNILLSAYERCRWDAMIESDGDLVESIQKKLFLTTFHMRLLETN